MDTQNSAVYQVVSALLEDLPRERAQLLPALWRVAESEGYLSQDAMEAVSKILGVPSAEVFGVASFYSLFEGEEGRVPVYICTDVMCALQGAQNLKDAAEKSAVNRPIAVKESACLGQCDHAPAAWIGGKVLRRASPDEVKTAVTEVRHD